MLLKPDVNRSSEQRDLFVWSSIGRRRNIQARVGWAISKRRVPTIVPVIIFQQIWGAFVSTSYLRIKQWVPCLYTWSLCSTRESSGWSFGTSEEKIYPGWNKQKHLIENGWKVSFSISTWQSLQWTLGLQEWSPWSTKTAEAWIRRKLPAIKFKSCSEQLLQKY